MKLIKKSEWFELPSPLGEPEIEWNRSYPYLIERIVKEDGDIIWFGLSVNWLKKKNGEWSVLSTNLDAKPLEKYLPEIVYGEDRNIFIPCDEPIYEQLYKII